MSVVNHGTVPAGVESPRAREQPFIHRFRTTHRLYVYDVNTNRILQVDRVVWDLLGIGKGWRSIAARPDGLSDYSEDEIRSAVRTCEVLHEELGALSSFRPHRLERVEPTGRERELYLHGLQHLILEVTQNCNLRCKYCTYSDYYLQRRGYTRKTMVPDTALRSIDYFLGHVKDTALPCVSFYGGEPLLNFELIRRCVEHALEVRRGAPLRFQLTTNGTVMSPEILDFFASHAVSILISLDGPPECHDSNRLTRTGRPTASRIMNNLAWIKRTNGAYYEKHVGFVSVLAPSTDPLEFADYFETHRDLAGNNPLVCNLVGGMGTDYWRINPPSAGWCESFTTLKWKFYEGLALRGERPNKVAANLFQPSLLRIYRRVIYKQLCEEATLNGCCPPGTRRLYLDCEGKYHMCERIEDSLPIGDVVRGIDPDRVSEVVDLYRASREKECCGCWALRLCTECFATGAIGGQFRQAKEDGAGCRQRRETIERDLSNYCEIAEVNPAAFQYMDDLVIK